MKKRGRRSGVCDSPSEIIQERLTYNKIAAQRARNSLWNRMADLVIHSDSLPADLSANKVYLKNYGQNRRDR